MSSENHQPTRDLIRPSTPQKLTVGERILVVTGIAGITAVLGTAFWLTPDPRGFGTHQQLGFPPCTFQSVMGFNCPHCGMTTSFCWFVRGAWGQSFQTNPAGLLLAGVCIGMWPWLVSVCVKGSWHGVRNPGQFFLYGSAGWLLLSLVFWLLRLAK